MHSLLHQPSPILTKVQRQHWNEKGFLVLPGHFSNAQVDAVNALVDQHWALSRTEKVETVVDIGVDTPEYKRVKLYRAPVEARLTNYRLVDLFLESHAVRQIALDARLSQILFELFKGHPLLCNSLNFEYGSQQEFHTDSLFMTPPVRLNLIATWIALEDVQADSGPLRYYPGSNLIQPFLFSNGRMTAIHDEIHRYRAYMQSQLQHRGLKDERFCAKAGDVFIWHSQLFHGGAPIENRKLTRKSVVFHYFRTNDLAGSHQALNETSFYMKRSPPKTSD